jgi:hypothetical protein
MRQEPLDALVTAEGKEKGRKPVDPPPIVEFQVSAHVDPSQQFLQSPYIFASVSLYKNDRDEPVDVSGESSLCGTLVSSLNRLRDTHNKEGGFFVFGDISIKIAGTFRLHFTVHEFQDEATNVYCLAQTISKPFKVHHPKDFRGLMESTSLSRTFGDQGVRLRIRKANGKVRAPREYDNESPQPSAQPELPDEAAAAEPNGQYNMSWNLPRHDDQQVAGHHVDDLYYNNRDYMQAFTGQGLRPHMTHPHLQVSASNMSHSPLQRPGTNMAHASFQGPGTNMTHASLQGPANNMAQSSLHLAANMAFPTYPSSNVSPMDSHSELNASNAFTERTDYASDRGSFPMLKRERDNDGQPHMQPATKKMHF